MREIKETWTEKPELQVIRLDRRREPKTENRITGREYRRMLRKAAFAFGVSLGANIVQAIIIYILQAGPV